MIHLTTGLPGNGKTLFTIATVKKRAEEENRRVFYSGIADLSPSLKWEVLDDPKKWAECPPGSIIVLDECQGVLPTRGQSAAVPSYVQAFSTHRHHGFDVYLITQDPMQFDHFVRRLVGVWWHLVRPFGMQYAQLWEFQKVGDFNDHFFRKDNGLKKRFDFPKDVFGLYHSAEIHTHKRRLPWRKFGGIGLLLGAIVACGFIAWRTLWGMGEDVADQSSKVVQQSAAIRPGGSILGGAPASAQAVVTPIQYLRARVPRVQDLPESAPVYDDLAKPVVFPKLAACWSSPTRGCVCYTQQGTVLGGISSATCEQFVLRGAFDPYAVASAPVEAKTPVSEDKRPTPHGVEPRQGGVEDPNAWTPPRAASSGPTPEVGTLRVLFGTEKAEKSEKEKSKEE